MKRDSARVNVGAFSPANSPTMGLRTFVKSKMGLSAMPGRGQGRGGLYDDVTQTIGNTPVVKISDKTAPAGVTVTESQLLGTLFEYDAIPGVTFKCEGTYNDYAWGPGRSAEAEAGAPRAAWPSCWPPCCAGWATGAGL